ncbi:arginyltransferase [Microvirga sp. W0021]|uniref:Aspartate/glutamate leucyltransferase n=1 Tax=Hohaiivirga grylli TaxID=3133970 RepID=A0ABV0BLC9_9HYPH
MTHHSHQTQRFYLTPATKCPYLPGQLERKIFTDIVGEQATELNDLLAHSGFRRSQLIAYRPACETCSACTSTRIVVDQFKPSSNMKRVRSHNQDLIGMVVPNKYTSEQYALFKRYLEARHRDGGMVEMSVLDYRSMIEESTIETFLIEYRIKDADSAFTGRSSGELVAVALTDKLSDGFSMVYSFFDPDANSRSLGTHIILDHIERSQKSGLPYLYLGYWVEGSRKMDYKRRYQPQELLTQNGWERVTL